MAGEAAAAANPASMAAEMNPYMAAAQGVSQVAGTGLMAWLSEMDRRRQLREQRRQFQAQMDANDLQQRRQIAASQKAQQDQIAANAASQTSNVLGNIAGLTNTNMDWAQRLAMMTGAK